MQTYSVRKCMLQHFIHRSFSSLYFIFSLYILSSFFSGTGGFLFLCFLCRAPHHTDIRVAEPGTDDPGPTLQKKKKSDIIIIKILWKRFDLYLSINFIPDPGTFVKQIPDPHPWYSVNQGATTDQGSLVLLEYMIQASPEYWVYLKKETGLHSFKKLPAVCRMQPINISI